MEVMEETFPPATGVNPEGWRTKMENLGPGAFPTLKNLTSNEILMIWDSVSECIREHLAQEKGVQLLGIGTFYVLKDFMCTVNSKDSIVWRPVFRMSKVIADECNLSYAKEDVPADVTIVPLRCEELSVCAQLPFTTVQCCVYETVASFFRATCKRQNTDFVFKAIGILSIRNTEVTMRFFEDFLLTVDITGNLLEALLSTPGRRYLVVLGGESPDFRVGPGGVFVLPQFDFTFPSEKKTVKCPSVGPLKTTEDRKKEKEEKEKAKEKEEKEKKREKEAKEKENEEKEKEKEEKEEEGDKQIKTNVPESPSTECLLSRRRRSQSPSTLSGPEKGKGRKGREKRSPSSFLPRIQEWEEKDGKHEQTLGVRPQTSLPVFRSKKRMSLSRQEASLQARWSYETLTEISPHSPLPRTGKEERTAPSLTKTTVKRDPKGSRELLRLNVLTNLNWRNLSSSSCPRREGLQPLSSEAGSQLSAQANYTLQLLKTYHMRRKEWSKRVELNSQRNFDQNQLVCIGRQMTLRDPRERYLDFWQNREHMNMTEKSTDVALSHLLKPART